MFVALKKILKCPNTDSDDFQIFGSVVDSNGEILNGVDDLSLTETDEIIDGVLWTEHGHCFPIRHGVLSILPDSSVNLTMWREMFEDISQNCPASIKAFIDSNLQRLEKSFKDHDGEWNIDEMEYYDSAVATPESREEMLQTIKNKYLGRTFHTRKLIILDELEKDIRNKKILEIGCGTSRTIFRNLPPGEYEYNYYGLDISFYRLVVAKKLMPESEFIQASATNLPFQDSIFDSALAFGAIHHFPRPIEALEYLDRVLKDQSIIGLHEPIETPKLVEGKIPFLERLLTTYEHSEHDGEVDVKEIREYLKNYGYSKSKFHYSITPFRTLTESAIRMASSSSVIESKTLSRILAPVDAIFVNSIGKASKLFGPRALTLLAERNRRSNDAGLV